MKFALRKSFAALMLAILLSSVAVALPGCASTRLDHMAVTNWTDRTIVPDNKAAQWALTPLLIPLTVGTLAIDNFLVAPIVHIPSAAIDAYEFVSAPIEGYYSRMGLAPIQLLLTPIVFTGSWIGRSFLAIDPEPEAAWTWPEWGRQWIREDGRLVGPPPPSQPEDGP